jgi:hypothetical protein
LDHSGGLEIPEFPVRQVGSSTAVDVLPFVGQVPLVGGSRVVILTGAHVDRK